MEAQLRKNRDRTKKMYFLFMPRWSNLTPWRHSYGKTGTEQRKCIFFLCRDGVTWLLGGTVTEKQGQNKENKGYLKFEVWNLKFSKPLDKDSYNSQLFFKNELLMNYHKFFKILPERPTGVTLIRPPPRVQNSQFF